MRSYEQLCGLALALDRVGERWALLVVRELLAGPRRFADLLVGMPGVATNTLTSRLEELEAAGVIARGFLPPPAASAVYELTVRGRALEPVVLAFATWGTAEVKAVMADPKRARTLAPLRSTWLALALKAHFTPPNRKLSGRLQLVLPTGDLGLVVGRAALELVYGAVSSPDVRLATNENGVIALVTHQITLTAAVDTGLAKLEGDAVLAEQLLSCFPIGDQAASANDVSPS